MPRRQLRPSSSRPPPQHDCQSERQWAPCTGRSVSMQLVWSMPGTCKLFGGVPAHHPGRGGALIIQCDLQSRRSGAPLRLGCGPCRCWAWRRQQGPLLQATTRQALAPSHLHFPRPSDGAVRCDDVAVCIEQEAAAVPRPEPRWVEGAEGLRAAQRADVHHRGPHSIEQLAGQALVAARGSRARQGMRRWLERQGWPLPGQLSTTLLRPGGTGGAATAAHPFASFLAPPTGAMGAELPLPSTGPADAVVDTPVGASAMLLLAVLPMLVLAATSAAGCGAGRGEAHAALRRSARAHSSDADSAPANSAAERCARRGAGGGGSGEEADAGGSIAMRGGVDTRRVTLHPAG